jgi:hypothetical protein
MRIENQDGRQLSVAATWKDKKTGELVIRVDTSDLTGEAWQDGIDQAMENS